MMAEQGEADVYKRFQTSAALQHAAHLVLQLAENITMAELSAGANTTGLACLLCVCGEIAETASCNAGNVRGGAATCFVAAWQREHLPVPFAGQGSEMQRTLPSSTPSSSCSWSGGRGKIANYPVRSGCYAGEQEGWKPSPVF